MKKIIQLLLLIIALSAISCKKQVIECNSGKIRLTSISSNPYNLYINDVFKVKITGNTFVEYNLPEGEYTFKVEQVSGYIAFPTIKTSKISIFGCKETEWVFPK